MNKAGSAAKVKLNSFDDLFGASDMSAGTRSGAGDTSFRAL